MCWIRNTLCAFLLALAVVDAAGPSARAVELTPRPIAAPLAETWSWDAFCKFWKRQLDKTSGVVGVVMLVAAAAVLLIISKTRR
jgi:hypothetical protein